MTGSQQMPNPYQPGDSDQHAALVPGRDNNGSCHCQRTSSHLFAEVNQVAEGATPASSPAQPLASAVSLDDALLLGRRLALEWERLNGCFNVEEHLNPHALLAMADAVERVLKLYEALLESTLSQRQAPVLVYPGDSSSFAEQAPAVSTFLGALELDGEEARIVAQEALRHIIARLGDLLKDMEEESRVLVHDTSENEAGVLADVKRAQDLMFRLLGRIPRW